MKHPAQAHTHGKRIALYSHDTVGIGHVRRNLLIAQTLASSPLRASVLLVSGAREAGVFAMPPGVDCLTLPSLCKEGKGHYQARRLGIALEELVQLRAMAIEAALGAFVPDVLIVDKVPRGALGELEATLELLRARGRTRCVLGLREVLDDPVTVREEWCQQRNNEAIRGYYDAIWVYGDPEVYDPVREYGFPADIAAKVRYTGYFDQRARLQFAAGNTGLCGDLKLPRRFVLCMVGGGEDGAHLAESFARAELPDELDAVLVTGPLMPPAVQAGLHRQAATNPRLLVVEFLAEPTFLLQRAERVIAMGGYNSASEVLSFEKPALIVPRVQPRTEQLIRVERLRDLGFVDMLHPDDVTPRTLSAWLAREQPPRRRVRDRIDLDGLKRLPRFLQDVLQAAPGGPGPVGSTGKNGRSEVSDLASRA